MFFISVNVAGAEAGSYPRIQVHCLTLRQTRLFMKYLSLTILLASAFLSTKAQDQSQEPEISIQEGIVIQHSVKVKKGTYYLQGNEKLAPSVTIDGDNICVDFNGSTIIGSQNMQRPDQFEGTCLLIKKGKNIIIKNAIIRGFKVGIMAKEVDKLQISDCDLSYNFRQHLKSTRLKEDLSDWMSYHHNENDEWLRFGAAIYMDSCSNAVISNNTITNGQCALMMTCSNNGKIYNNNFSYNSGVGIGLYRSNYNQVLNNKVDWNVRGFSYGYYYRGQDSGGMLVFSQSSNNVFANNSVTHSGDGFFLWAGQETQDQGLGGCNDNLIYHNDFSYAPTNAVEITFSRNKVIKNKLHDSWHGIWGGFSYNTIIARNDFGGNLAAISIEHGQDNIIQDNHFTGDKVGIELWAIPNRHADFGLMKVKDTRSKHYIIAGNHFDALPLVYSIRNTQGVQFWGNQEKDNQKLAITDTLNTGFIYDQQPVKYDFRPDSIYVASLMAEQPMQDAFLPASHPQGKQNIMMTEWGPYNFAYPLIWWTNTKDRDSIDFDVYGPAGNWKVKKLEGAKLLSASGSMPGKLLVKKDAHSKKPLYIALEYKGDAFTDPFGNKIEKNQPYVFEYTGNSIPMQWSVSWFAFDKKNDPLHHPAEFERLLKDSSPIAGIVTSASEFDQAKGRLHQLPGNHFATIVNTSIQVPAGKYIIGLTAGEMARLYVDGKLLIDAWDPEKIQFDADYHHETTVTLKGKHHIQIIKAQYGGYGMLDCQIRRQTESAIAF